jgi:hypothetical protein
LDSIPLQQITLVSSLYAYACERKICDRDMPDKQAGFDYISNSVDDTAHFARLLFKKMKPEQKKNKEQICFSF